MMRLLYIAFAATGLMSASAALAANGGYSSGVAIPSMTQTNKIYTTADATNLSSPNGSVPITSFSWTIGASSTSQGAFQGRVCTASQVCSAWVSGYSGSTTVFNGLPASTVFHFEVRVSASTAAVLSPKVVPSGKSYVNVSYIY